MTYPQFNSFRELLISELNKQIVNRANEQSANDTTTVPNLDVINYVYPMMIDLLEAYHLWMSKNQDETES